VVDGGLGSELALGGGKTYDARAVFNLNLILSRYSFYYGKNKNQNKKSEIANKSNSSEDEIETVENRTHRQTKNENRHA
jgi:hypothetical protein